MLRSEVWRLCLSTIMLVALGVLPAAAKNGFQIKKSGIKAEEFRERGFVRGGIPSLDYPNFIDNAAVTWLAPFDKVLGVSSGGVGKAYPVRILNWHEIVNDEINGVRVLVSYCTLCGSGKVFAVDEQDEFGVSGLVYNSDLLFYDHATESLWSHVLGQAISGPRKGEKLTQLVSRLLEYAPWLEKWPNTWVLDRETGYTRDYHRDLFASYHLQTKLLFQVSHPPPSRTGLHPKERVLGLLVDGEAVAYPFSFLREAEGNSVTDFVGGEKFKINISKGGDTGWADDKTGLESPVFNGYWFIWHAFHPDTNLFNP